MKIGSKIVQLPHLLDPLLLKDVLDYLLLCLVSEKNNL
jgi:hypothetical protein